MALMNPARGSPLLLPFVWSTLGVVFVVAALMFSLSQPWLGINLNPIESGWEIYDLEPDSPAQELLNPGEVLTAIRVSDSQVISLSPLDLRRQPDTLPSYESYNQFMERQSIIHNMLRSGEVTFILDNNREVNLFPEDSRPIATLSPMFWLLALCGQVALTLTVTMYSFRSDYRENAFIMSACGTAYLVVCVLHAIHSTRETVLNGEQFQLYMLVLHLFALIFSYGAMTLTFFYPRKFCNLPMIPIVGAWIVLVWLNEAFQIIQWPLHAFWAQFTLPLIIALVVLFLQFRRLGKKTEKVMIHTVIFCLVGIFLAFLFYFIPISLGAQENPDTSVAVILCLSLVLGIFFIMLRFRLFQVDRWLAYSWYWFLGGFFILILDLGIFLWFYQTPYLAIGIILMLLGWLWFPLRQYQIVGMSKAKRSLELELPDIMNTILSMQKTRDFNLEWINLLSSFYNPSKISLISNDSAEEDDGKGLILIAESFVEDRSVLLQGKDKSKSLFEQEDRDFVTTVKTLIDKVLQLKTEKESLMETERARIMRDLHDDVCPNLLTLIHRAEEKKLAETARTTLKSLREIIYSLDESNEYDLKEIIDGLIQEAEEQLSSAKIELAVRNNLPNSNLRLSSRQKINLSRVMKEIVANSIRHSGTNKFVIQLSEEEDELIFTLSDEGKLTELKTWVLGTGINSMTTRIEELGGSLKIRSNEIFICEFSTGISTIIRIPKRTT